MDSIWLTARLVDYKMVDRFFEIIKDWMGWILGRVYSYWRI